MTALQRSTEIDVLDPLPQVPSLHTAPARSSVDRYLSSGGRWVQVASLVGYLPAVVCIGIFSLRSPWLWPFLVVVVMNLTGLLLTAFTALRRGTITAETHELQWSEWLDDRYVDGAFPSVDVFLPCCGEPLEVLRNTYRHVSRLQWGPGLRVWVLDDSGSSRVAEAAASFGFEYLSRPNRGEMKKAGNLKYAFEHSDADLVAIFDADFCPREDYLLQLVPYFDDAEVGIVQSPQYFATTATMGWLERGAGSTQEMFYRWIQTSRDALGAAICVGTCAIYRRTALEAAGGFVQIEHSEDVHTGVAVVDAGSRLQYVPAVLSQGLCPDDLASFVNQQYRWCTGSLSLLAKGLKRHYDVPYRQRLCFWSGFMYYLSTAVNAVVLPIPGLVMLAFYAEDIQPKHLLPFLPALFVQMVVMPRLMTTRWRPDVVRVQLAYSFAHLVALIHAVRRRSAAWVPTGAGSAVGPIATQVGRLAVVAISTSVIASWTAFALDVHRYGFERYSVLVVFMALYSYYAIPLVVGFVRMLTGSGPGKRSRGRDLDRVEESVAASRLPWSDVAARTVLLVSLGLYAAGAIDLDAFLLR
ncbi:cellulose synthase (UDP-forming) [Marmoricola sp. OAE513]|uniref:glycosyltransferase family 2 protein n=1 Tax=Marmoricola sp. OAE513 TaxID=2817894 RepID=UPI001AE7B492